VLLVADPQVLDHRSYPDRPTWLMWLSQRIVDYNMRKSWWATKQLHPDVVIFLGDMMDNGRFAMPDAECVRLITNSSRGSSVVC
jgi:ethanolamine phosphate phosphodiesterase